MAKWGEIKCPRCAELEAENHLLKTSGIVEVAVRNQNVMEYMRHWEGRAERAEAKLAKAVEALRGWIEFANEEGMPVLLSDLEAAELTGGKDE